MALILHIPHASRTVPTEYRGDLVLSDRRLNFELLKMTDHFTDEIFAPCATGKDSVLQFPVSRLVLDPERFRDDEQESMSERGMGVVYTKCHDGSVLRSNLNNRSRLIEEFYSPHHRCLDTLVQQALEDCGQATILDCHSFPGHPLPYEPVQDPNRPEICIGTDDFHTPNWLRDALVEGYRRAGYSVAIDTPFAGSLVPFSFYRSNPNVRSVMIEIRRDLYMNESSGDKGSRFEKVRSDTQRAVAAVRDSMKGGWRG